MCLVSSNKIATLQNVLLIHVKHTNNEMHVHYTKFTFHTFDIKIHSKPQIMLILNE